MVGRKVSEARRQVRRNRRVQDFEEKEKVFENKVLRKIFGAKRDEVTGEWRKLHNTELHALYSSPDIITNIKSRRLRWAGHVARMGESRNAYRVLVGRPEVKRPLGRPRRRWEDNIKMDLREVGYDDRDWINLAQDRDHWRAYVPKSNWASRILRARCHVSAATMQWYADNNVHRLDWPAQSPDLNPIKHIWDELDRRLRFLEIWPTSIAQLSAMLQEEWRRIPVDILHKLVESMPDRVAAVIATSGGTMRF
ncbi:hypothetical protein ANN_10764 [Periplaneta americana]|uniref:Tc1-like transposase DDE domain-containing protein n=1 Tax=Periplaneta americana TaxID=6978 RepID=A0ABQ8T4C7_PERAM|nr:hypothetical protein ANN_10764 [Periplaneta americana]